MDEFELIRRFYGEVSEVDAVARARALARLRSPRRMSGRAVAIVIGTAAALVAVAVGLSAVSLRRDVGSDPTQDPARIELRALARLAEGRDLAVGGRPVVYERTESLEQESVDVIDTGREILAEVRRATETWRSPNGSVLQISEVVSVRFTSEQDRDAWRDLGHEVPAVGDVQRVEIPSGEIPFPDLSDLPLEPDALVARLREGWWPQPLEDDAETLLAIADLLARGDAGPELRSALFQAAANLESVELLGAWRDPQGDQGIGFAAGPDRDVVIVVDHDTSTLLSIEERLGASNTWIAFQEVATVNGPGDRPSPVA